MKKEPENQNSHEIIGIKKRWRTTVAFSTLHLRVICIVSRNQHFDFYLCRTNMYNDKELTCVRVSVVRLYFDFLYSNHFFVYISFFSVHMFCTTNLHTMSVRLRRSTGRTIRGYETGNREKNPKLHPKSWTVRSDRLNAPASFLPRLSNIYHFVPSVI